MSKPAPKPAPKNQGPRRATTRVITRTVEQDDGDDSPEEQDNGEEFIDPTEEVLESVFAEARGHSGVEIRVYKLDPENRSGARAYAMSVSLEDAEGGRLLDQLQRKWKGGEFELMARADGRIVKRAVINVLPPPEDEKPNPVQAREEIANIVKASMEPMLQVIAELRNRPQFNFNDLLQKGMMLMPLVSQLRGILTPASNVTNPSDPLAILTQMKTMKETMDALGMGDREPDGIDRMLSLFNTVGKPLLEKMQVAQAAQRQRPPSPVPPTAGNVVPLNSPTVVNPTLTQQFNSVAPNIPDELQPYLPILLVAARGGETPETVAERILNAVPDSVIDPLADSLEDGSLIGALLARPEFVGMAPWLNALAKSILEALSSGEAEPEEADVSGTSDTDTPGATDGNT